MNQQASKRIGNIAYIKNIIIEAKKKKIEINNAKFAMEISIKRNVSLRTAKEYIKLATFKK